MRRVPPSTVIREEIDQLLTGGVRPRNSIISTLADLGLRYIVQHGLEQEQKDFLARAHYERRDDTSPRGIRNGYEDASIKTAEGEAGVRVPRSERQMSPVGRGQVECQDGRACAVQERRLAITQYRLQTLHPNLLFVCVDNPVVTQ